MEPSSPTTEASSPTTDPLTSPSTATDPLTSTSTATDPSTSTSTATEVAPSTEPSNPFVHKCQLSLLQKVKICVLGVVLLPIRVVFILLSLTVATIIARIGLLGLTEEQQATAPFTGWRLYIRYAICAILRVMFAVCGFWRVEVRGRQASPQAAPILCVAPHSTFFDALAVVVMGAPSVVAKADTKNVPLFGSLILYTQPLLVHRTEPDSRKKTLDTMKERSVEGKGWQQVLIFPEGTCTNRTALITFRLGAFIPGVPVQPVIIRWNNALDTVTWTWEGIPAWQVVVFSLCQFAVHLSLEFLPPHAPSEEERAAPQLFANNVRAEMAARMGVGVTDCSYYDYLRIDKARQMVKAFRRLQRRVERPLEELLELPAELPRLEGELEALGQGGDARPLRLAVLMATREDSYETFLTQAFAIFDPDLGEDRMAEESLRRIAETFLFLPPKEVGEMAAASAEGGAVSLARLRAFLPAKRPNYIKAVRVWEEQEKAGLPAMSLTAAAEQAKQFMAAGKEVVSDVSASMAASRDKVSDVFSSAVTSLHKRTGSGRVVVDRKAD